MLYHSKFWLTGTRQSIRSSFNFLVSHSDYNSFDRMLPPFAPKFLWCKTAPGELYKQLQETSQTFLCPLLQRQGLRQNLNILQVLRYTFLLRKRSCSELGLLISDARTQISKSNYRQHSWCLCQLLCTLRWTISLLKLKIWNASSQH